MNFCMKCGSKLADGLCPECDKNTDLENNPNKTIDKKNKHKTPASKKKRAIIISVCAVAVLAIAAGAVFLSADMKKKFKI